MTNNAEFEQFIASPALSASVQQNADTYFAKWRAMFAKAQSIKKMQSTRSWNWAAFIFSGFWLVYRRMYVLGGLYLAIFVGLSAFAVAKGDQGVNAIAFVMALLCGMYGNGWYFHHLFSKTAGGTQPLTNPGVSWASAVVSVVAYIAANTATMIYGGGLSDIAVASDTSEETNNSSTGRVWDSSLEELTGVWTAADGTQLEALFAGGQAALRMTGSGLTLPIHAEIQSLDTANDGVTFEANIAERAFRVDPVQRAALDNPPETPLWTIRKERDGNSFRLALIMPGGQPAVYGYVRELTAKERTELQGIKGLFAGIQAEEAKLLAEAAKAKADLEARERAIAADPAAKAAAERLGADTGFLASTPEQRDAALASARADIADKLGKTQRELNQINSTAATDEVDHEFREKRKAELLRRLDLYTQQSKDLGVMTKVNEQQAAQPDETNSGDDGIADASVKADSYYEEEDTEEKPPR